MITMPYLTGSLILSRVVPEKSWQSPAGTNPCGVLRGERATLAIGDNEIVDRV